MLKMCYYISLLALIFKNPISKIIGLYNQFSIFFFIQVIVPIEQIFRKSIII